MLYTKEALWTLLRIETSDELSRDRIESIFDTVFLFEQRYSRFIKWNFLSKLNASWKAPLDEELRTLLKASNSVFEISFWYFDITLTPLLENLGYGISKTQEKEIFGMEHIEVSDSIVILKNGVQLDFWGIGKGYLIDKIYAQLELECSNFIINFWGDIKVKGSHTLWLEDPLTPWRLLGKLIVENISLCGSSWEKRKFWTSHHLINPKTKKSQEDTLAVFTTHRLAIFADMYATALFVSPLEISLEILEKVEGLEALIVTRSWEMFQSRGFGAQLF